jgi:hypothetical protein
LVQQWMQRLLEEGAHGLQHLLPDHKCLGAAAAEASDGSSLKLAHENTHYNGGGSSGSGSSSLGDAAELSDEQALLMRVQQLTDWAGSEQHQQLMAAARPLRRVVQRGRAPSA